MDITKAAGAVGAQEIDDAQLAAVNRHTRRELGKDEVFLFSVVLCDNDVDRDWERFDDDALDTLGELFVGKTGVFDHSAKAENQSARIFEARTEEDPARVNALGMPYRYLKAWAYMVRCDKNEDLILEIDAGIKKEVSVGCAVEQVLCSMCGQDQRQEPCNHQKGKVYDSAACHHILSHPTDAYEWSFVAVPAQKNAGVTKRYQPTGEGAEMTLQKFFAEGGGVTITREQRAGLEREYRKTLELARAGGAYMDELRREVMRLALLGQPGMDPAVLEEVVQCLGHTQLKAFHKAYALQARESYPIPQLGGEPDSGPEEAMYAFKI